MKLLNSLNDYAMDYEELSDLIGCFCTLLTEPDNAFCGRIVGEFGNELAVEMCDRVEVADRCDVLIFD
jgi:hypothetical protein